MSNEHTRMPYGWGHMDLEKEDARIQAQEADDYRDVTPDDRPLPTLGTIEELEAAEQRLAWSRNDRGIRDPETAIAVNEETDRDYVLSLRRLIGAAVLALFAVPSFAAAVPAPATATHKAPTAKCERLTIGGRTVWAKATKSGYSTAACEPRITLQVGTVDAAVGYAVAGKVTAQRCTVKITDATLKSPAALVKATQACVDAMAAADGV